MAPSFGLLLAACGCLWTGTAAAGQDQLPPASEDQVPLVQKGIRIHEVEVEDEGRPVQYLVDNSRLKHKGPGVLWRLSKDMANVSDKSYFVKWNSTVLGTNGGDGWVQVGDLFLPMTVNGKKVLLQQVDPEEAQAKAELVKRIYVPTEVRAQDGSWIRCNITGVGSKPDTYNITVLPSTFSSYTLDNVAVDRLKKVKIIRRFLPVTRKPYAANTTKKLTGEEVISVQVVYPRGGTGRLKFLTKSPMRVIMKMACDRLNIEWSLCSRAFYFTRAGQKVYPDDTVSKLKLENDETFQMVKVHEAK